MRAIDRIREKVKRGEYEFAIPHFLEEMLADDFNFKDVEFAIMHGKIGRRFLRDPRGIRYEAVGPSVDGRRMGIICRIKRNNRLLFITTYALEA